MSAPEILGKKACTALNREIGAFCEHHRLSRAAFADLAGLSSTQLSHRIISRVQWRAHEAARARAVMAIEPPPRLGRAKPAAPDAERVEVPKVELSAAPVRMRTTELPGPEAQAPRPGKSVGDVLADAMRNPPMPRPVIARHEALEEWFTHLAKKLDGAGHRSLADQALRAAWHEHEGKLALIYGRLGAEFDPFAGMEGKGSED